MYKISLDLRTNEQNGIVKIATNEWIPLDIKNVDYQEYLKWVAEGNEPLPAGE